MQPEPIAVERLGAPFQTGSVPLSQVILKWAAMNATEQELLTRRLLYIMHLGFTEVRNLALATNHERIADLADAMEILPRFIGKELSDEDLELIRFVLKTYQDKHPSSFNYPARFDCYEPPERY